MRIAVSDLKADAFDLSDACCIVAACGTEERSTAVFSHLQLPRGVPLVVVEFEESVADESFLRAKELYKTHDGPVQFAGSKDISLIVQTIATAASGNAHAHTIVLDISSMRRTTYVAVIQLTRFRLAALGKRLLVVYAEGKYSEDYPARQLLGARGTVGTGGFMIPSAPTLACFGLGFDAGAILSMEERIEPDAMLAILALDRPVTDRARKAKELNRDILTRATSFELPHMSFEEPYRFLVETLASYRAWNIVCVPLGPKTHTVSFVLAGIMLRNAVCMDVLSKFSSPFRATATGRFASALVEFVGASASLVSGKVRLPSEG